MDTIITDIVKIIKSESNVIAREKALLCYFLNLFRELMAMALEKVDEELIEETKDQGYQIEKKNKRSIITAFGDVNYSRRRYIASGKKAIYHLDSLMGYDRYKRYSVLAVKNILQVSAVATYRNTALAVNTLSCFNISHCQIGNLIKQAGKRIKEQQEHLKELKDKSLMKELKGNKIIHWTPFPLPPREIPNFSNVAQANSRMNILKSFPGHLSSVTSIDFHPKKAIIGTSSDDKTWKLWKYPTGELLMHGEGHKDWVSSINFHPDGVFVATCGGDSTIKFWNILEERCVHTIIDHADPVWKTKFHFSGDFMLTCSMDHTIRLYDLNNNKARMSYRAHVDSVNSINWLYMTNLFVSGSADKTVSLWDMRTNICSQTFYGHNNSVNCVQATNSGDMIGSCDSDGIVKFWDVRMVKEIESFDE